MQPGPMHGSPGSGSLISPGHAENLYARRSVVSFTCTLLSEVSPKERTMAGRPPGPEMMAFAEDHDGVHPRRDPSSSHRTPAGADVIAGEPPLAWPRAGVETRGDAATVTL